MLDHGTIEEEQIAERYVMGKLPPDEATRFEEHYLSCQECLDRLELAESMERGFKRAAGQDAARVAATRQLALVVWLSRLGRSRQAAALLAAVVVVALLPGLVGYWEVRERSRVLDETRTELEQERERSTAGSRRAADETTKLKKNLEESRRDLDKERRVRAAVERERDAAWQPQGNVRILYLGVERGVGKPPEVHLPSKPGWIVVSLDVEPGTYRVILRDSQGRVLWSDEGLHANPEERAVTVSLHSTWLSPGDYTLTANLRAPNGKPYPAGRFVFRALPPG